MSAAPRIISIDAARGLVMAAMIFVNDLAGAGDLVPDWLVHFSDRHPADSGMTFVDLVFPAFLFIVGLSIPLSLGASLRAGKPVGKVLQHVVVRTLSLLFLGVLMVNGSPDSDRMGWSGTWWTALLYLSAIAAFCEFTPQEPAAPNVKLRRTLTIAFRLTGFALLLGLAFSYVGADGHRIVSFAPFNVHTEWWGILGLIGWAYLSGALVYVIFREERTGLLGCMALMLCLFAAERAGMFEGFWLAQRLGFGSALGSHASITIGGVLLGTTLSGSAAAWPVSARVRFTLWFFCGTAAAATLVQGLYGISKNSATPSWCLWASAIAAALWLVLYLVSDVWEVKSIARPLAVAGQNVLLAYLLSELLPSVRQLLHLAQGYEQIAHAGVALALARSIACAIFVLLVTTALNRRGFRLRL